MGHPVGKVAALAGITVRTLHHYDEIGLLSPSGRTAAGYRSYADEDLDRLQRILFYRELGFPLETIATLVDDPGIDADAHLERQRELLVARIGELGRMVAAVDRVMEARAMGNALTPEEKFEVFGEFREPDGYAEEAARRWAHTPEWRGAATPSKEDLAAGEAARKEWVARLHAVLDAGGAPDGPEAGELAEAHREMLSRVMGECSYETQRRIGALYVTEPVQLEFLVRADEQRPGVGAFIRDAIEANAAHREE
ncbi:MerR family transcriptional regulator [Amycolatopsis sp. SID8362]|uniref:MerR family transcriptional regulator n=1 Tax=Amycolatopsis sp. SID8362 TaxID=2690346 RepID=UPI0013704288|nr:MerR family transcriptional regulator [Amycolatopsis sp. SID8362]NBH05876.1 MerR family DNA-binding transcriptional regulator [Amycolatopsis sp. SID8362]NED42574.1 MerR family transcriptional regulator [Amycolatopsis sp. SID8362]